MAWCLLCLGHFGVNAQKGWVFDHGNNKSYTPYKGFAVPVAKPTDPNHPPVVGLLSNLEKDIATKAVKGAVAGLHFAPGSVTVKTVRYDLYITDSSVQYSGKSKRAIAVNGQLPGPTLSFTIGDTALIYVHNQSKEPTTVHWHGVQLANKEDGVSYLTQHPIAAGTTYIYKFPVVQSGTYWYHSHYSLQEQVGLYGALIFNKRTEPDIPTIPVVLSDWSDMKPSEIDRRLHTASDWFSIKKGAVQSYSEALKAGKLGTKFVNEWKRMKAMDVSDVYYEQFLINGQIEGQVEALAPNGKVRLRVVNAGASTYFWLTYGGGPLTVVASDGNDVEPVEVDRLIIGPSETYDLIVNMDSVGSYPLVATAEDRTGRALLYLGKGQRKHVQPIPKLKYFEGMKMMNAMMKTSGKMDDMGMAMSLQTMDMNNVMYPELSGEGMEHEMDSVAHMGAMTSHVKYSCPMHPEVVSEMPGKCPICGMSLEKLDSGGAAKGAHPPVTLNYDMLKATTPTRLSGDSLRTLVFELTGNMNRYVWTINNKTVSETDKILVKDGEALRIILRNNSMMRHPMHLHGHDFRLLNHFADWSPMKNVVDILPMETDTLEFKATEPGDWFFHCHILYHMMSGMGRIFSNPDTAINPEMPHPDMGYKMVKMDDRMFHLKAENDFATNGNDGSLVYAKTRWEFQGEWRLGYNDKDGYEVETHFGRYLDQMQWLFPYLGVDWRHRKQRHLEKSLFGQTNTKDDRKVFHVGLQYTLPWLVVADASVDHNGYFRMQFSREDIALTPRLRASFMVNSDREYSVGGKYILTKLFSVSTHYDSDMGWGAGVTLTY